MKPGDRLENGAQLLAETVYNKDDDGLRRSIVLGMSTGSATPFVTWEHVEDNNQASGVVPYCFQGHYHRSIVDAVKEYDERCEARTHEKAHRDAISERAKNDAKTAAGWFFNGDPSLMFYSDVLKGLEDGDPEILDALPKPRLNGEFADDPTWEDILKAELDEYDESKIDGEYDELFELYHQEFDAAVHEAIVATCVEMLGTRV